MAKRIFEIDLRDSIHVTVPMVRAAMSLYLGGDVPVREVTDKVAAFPTTEQLKESFCGPPPKIGRPLKIGESCMGTPMRIEFDTETMDG